MSGLPAGWVATNLFNLCYPTQWKTISTSELFESGYLVYGANGVIGFYDKFTHANPTLMITCRGATCGNIHLSKPFSYINGNAMALDNLVSEVCHIKYLEYYLTIRGFNDVITGTAQPQITRASLMPVTVPLAPAAEQTRIVTKLDALLTELDAGVAQLKAAQKKLVQYRQSLLKAAVEGTLTADWRTQQPQPQETGEQLLERILTERRSRWQAKQLAKYAAQGKPPPKDWQSKYPEPVQPDTTDLPALPQGWVWASAEQLCDFITKGTTPPKSAESIGKKDIPFLRVTNLTNAGVLDLTDKVWVSENIHAGFLARSIVYPNDVLMNIVGPPLGQVSIVPNSFPEWNINQAIAIFRTVAPISASFMCNSLLSKPIQNWLLKRSKTTAGQTNLTLETCRSLPIGLPPLLEQHAISQMLEQLTSGSEEQTAAIDTALKQSAAQRKNILKAAFAGELVPQDPSDEPASALLARIAVQRASHAALNKGGKVRSKTLSPRKASA